MMGFLSVWVYFLCSIFPWHLFHRHWNSRSVVRVLPEAGSIHLKICIVKGRVEKRLILSKEGSRGFWPELHFLRKKKIIPPMVSLVVFFFACLFHDCISWNWSNWSPI